MSRSTLSVLVALVAIPCAALVGCSDRDEERPARREAAPTEPPGVPSEPAPREPSARIEDPAHAGLRCALSEPTPIATGLAGGHAVAIAASDNATMIAIDRDASTMLTLGVRAVEGARPIEVPMAGADELFGLEALDDDRFVVLTHTRCPEDVSAARCLFAQLLGSDARPIGAAIPIGLAGPLRTVRIVSSGAALYIARSHARRAPELDRVDVTETGLESTTLRLGDGLSGEEPTEILGLAVTGGSWAVLWRHGGAEDAHSGVVLSTQLDEHEVEALEEALVLDSFQWYAGALSMIAAFEFARPQFLRIGADGEMRGPARALPPGEALPQPFAMRRTASIVGTGSSAAIEVRDGAGDTIASVPLATPGYAFADVARRGSGFVLAIATREAEGTIGIVSRELRCDLPASPTTTAASPTTTGASPTAPAPE